MTTAHNIVPAPGPAFARPSGGGGPTVMTKPWPEWAMLRAEEVREKLPPEQWGPWTNRGQCLVSNTITGSSNQMAPHPTEEPYFFHCKAHLQAIRAKKPHRQAVASPGQRPVHLMRRPRRAAARHHGRPSRVRPSGEDQQHGGSPERQTTLRQMQPEPSPAVPRPDLPRDRSEAPGPTGRMLQYHQDQPASPLCRMLRRRRRQSVCSGHAAHHHRSRHRREKKK